MEELTLVINQPDEGKFLQKIGWNKKEIMDAVKAITEQYEGLTYTDEQMAAAKKDRANLNSLRNAISGRRIEVKKALLAPYDAFEAEVKEVVSLIDKPIAMIDEQTKAYEDKLKEDKARELRDFFAGNVGELGSVLTFDMIFNQRWLNKSYSIKSCKDEIMAEIKETETDLGTIEAMIDEKYRAYAKDFYFRKNRNMTAVLQEVGRMKEIDRKAGEERLAREEAERRRREEAAKAAQAINPPSESENVQEKAENVAETPESVSRQPVTDPFADKDTDTKIYKASFTIRGTKAQILSVKEFMIANKIQFGKVER